MDLRVKKSEIVKIVILAFIIIWIICFFVDYFRARQSKLPLFCIHKTVSTYEDGQVTGCTGIGYKMYKYERTSIPVSVQFGPLFIKERTE